MKLLVLLAILCSSCISPAPTIPYMQTEAFASYMRSTQDKPKFKKGDEIYLIDKLGKKYIGTVVKVGLLGVWESDKGEKRVARAYAVLLTFDGETGLVEVPEFILKKNE